MVKGIVAQGALHALVLWEYRFWHAHGDFSNVRSAVPDLANEAIQYAAISIHITRHLQHYLAHLICTHREAVHYDRRIRFIVLQKF